MNRLTVKPGYEVLATVLDEALRQAQSGKGEQRHANDLPFEQQPMQRLIQSYGVGFALGQAAKKGEESQKLTPGHDVAEILGAIVYLAGAVVHLQRRYDSLEKAKQSATLGVGFPADEKACDGHD